MRTTEQEDRPATVRMSAEEKNASAPIWPFRKATFYGLFDALKFNHIIRFLVAYVSNDLNILYLLFLQETYSTDPNVDLPT
jgi:hypothetical protein